MNELLLKQAKALRAVADDMERAAKADRPAPQLIAVAVIRRMRGEAKSIRHKLSSNYVKTGNGYKGTLQGVEEQLTRFANDLERWLEAGEEPWWAENITLETSLKPKDHD